MSLEARDVIVFYTYTEELLSGEKWSLGLGFRVIYGLTVLNDKVRIKLNVILKISTNTSRFVLHRVSKTLRPVEVDIIRFNDFHFFHLININYFVFYHFGFPNVAFVSPWYV